MTQPSRDAAEEPPDAQQTDELSAVRAENAQLKQAMTSHASIDQAIGVIVAVGHCTPETGWIVLREVSQHTNTKLRSVAELVITWGRDGHLPAGIHTALLNSLARHSPRP